MNLSTVPSRRAMPARAVMICDSQAERRGALEGALSAHDGVVPICVDSPARALEVSGHVHLSAIVIAVDTASQASALAAELRRSPLVKQIPIVALLPGMEARPAGVTTSLRNDSPVGLVAHQVHWLSAQHTSLLKSRPRAAS